MQQHFECPISVTKCWNKAYSFCKDNGIILKLKAANHKTRYFDVSFLSHLEQEKERLVMGASLQIVDIYVGSMSSKQYISSLKLFEQIINAKYIDLQLMNYEIQDILYRLMINILGLNINSNTSIPIYIMALFEHMVDGMKDTLCLNRRELNKINHNKLNKLIPSFFKHFNIDYKWIQEFEWHINGDDYKQFINMKPRKYYKSNKYKYVVNDDEEITFHFEICSKYSDETSKVALFFHIDDLPYNIEGIRIEYDLFCDKKSKYCYNTMLPQWLTRHKEYCGFKTFSTKCLKRNSFINWNFAIKVIDIRYNI